MLLAGPPARARTSSPGDSRLTSQPQVLHPAAPPEPSATRRPRGGWWLLAFAVATAVSLTLTWPLALHPGQRWLVRLPGPRPGQFGAPPAGTFSANDSLQTMHVNRVVIDDVLHLREPYLDLVSGAAGPEPLRTTSLDLPWTPLEALLLPLAGLVAAYNTTLVLSSVLTVLCAFGLLRRHTRYPLLAVAGALLYAFVPGRMFQLSLHFNAVLWWAFPAAAWALEAMLERHRAGRRWLAPGLWLAGVTLVVGLSGEYHHSLYLSGMLGFLVVWRLVEAAVRRTHALLADLLRHEHASLALAQRCSGVPAPAPLFSALLNYRYSQGMVHAPSAEAMQAWEGVEVLYGEERTNYPLTLSVDDLGEGFGLTAQVQDPIDPRRVCDFMNTALERLVEALERAPTRAVRSLDVLPEAERRQVVVEWNATEAKYPKERCIHQLFEAQVEQAPEAVAVVFEEHGLSYRALNRRANQLAHHLQGLGVGPEVLVGICLERSIDRLLALLR